MKNTKFKKEGLDMEKFRADLLKMKAEALKYGVDLGEFWKGLLASEKTKGKK